MPIDAYIQTLPVSGDTLAPGRDAGRRDGMMGVTPGAAEEPRAIPETLKAAVDAGSVLSFVDGLTAEEREDVLYSVQLAHRSATNDHDPFLESQSWYRRYVEILQMLGWTAEQHAFAAYDQSEGELRMDKAALALITAIATQNQLAVLTEAIRALEKLAEDDDAISLFDFHTSTDVAGNFQLGAVQKGEDGALSMAVGSFYFRCADRRRKFLFVSWGENQVNFWTAAQKMTLNRRLYAVGRDAVRRKLERTFHTFVAALEI